jgi:hypothetical protein
MTANLARDITNQEDYITEEQSYLEEVRIVCEWIKLEASRKNSTTCMSSLSDRVISFLRKNKFVICDNADGSHWISWSEPSQE